MEEVEEVHRLQHDDEEEVVEVEEVDREEDGVELVKVKCVDDGQEDDGLGGHDGDDDQQHWP